MGSSGQGIRGTVEKFSGRTGNGSVRLVDGRLVRFSAGKMLESGVRDLRPGDSVTVELRKDSDGVVSTTISLRETAPRARDLRRRIKAAEKDIPERLDRPLKILLVGRTGVGKSSTINSLLGVQWATVGDHEPETATIHSYEGQIGSATVQVVDTPGFCDDHPDKGNDERYVRQIGEYIGEIDLMLFVTMLDDTRVRADELRALELLTDAFGEGIWDKAVAVFTRSDFLRSADYSTKMEGRFGAFRKALRKIASKAGSVPFVPVSNVKSRTPDRRLWLPALWIACLERMSDEGFEPFFLSTADRLETASRTRGGGTDAPTKSTTATADSTRRVAKRLPEKLPAHEGKSAMQSGIASPASAREVPKPRAKSRRPASGHAAKAGPPSAPTPRPVPATSVALAVTPTRPVESSDPSHAVVDRTSQRREGGVQIIETKLSVADGRGTIVVTGDQARIVQKMVERKAPNLLTRLAKIGASLLPKLKRILGF